MINECVKQTIIRYQRDVTVHRHNAGDWDLISGKYNRDNSTTLTIKAVVQRPNDQEIMLLDEAERSKTLISVWSLSPIYTTNEQSQSFSDIIEVDGVDYRVLSVNNRYLGEYYKALCGGING